VIICAENNNKQQKIQTDFVPKQNNKAHVPHELRASAAAVAPP